MDYIKFIFAIIITEAITNILVKAEITKPIRQFFFDRKRYKIFEFIHNLLDCGYCTSVWIGIMAALYLTYIDSDSLNILFLGLVFHRFSNMFHFMIDWLDLRRGQGKN